MATPTLHDQLTIVKLLVGGRDLDFVAAAVTLPREVVKDAAEANGWPDPVRLGWAADHLQSEIDRAARAAAPHRLTPVPRPIKDRVADPRPNPPTPIRPTPIRPAPQPQEITTAADLVAAAAQSDRAATRAKGIKLAQLLDELPQLLTAEKKERELAARASAERETLLAETVRLEELLRQAQAKLAKLGGPSKSSAAASKAGKRVDSPAAVAARDAAHARQRDLLARFDVTKNDILDWAALNGHAVNHRAPWIAQAVLDAYAKAHV